MAAARWTESEWLRGLGAAGKMWLEAPLGEDAVAPMSSSETIFDLASLTKPVTALVLARLERQGIVRRNQLLGEILIIIGTGLRKKDLNSIEVQKDGRYMSCL